MSDGERVTITLSSDVVAIVRDAVVLGDYTSVNDVVQSALRDWIFRRVPLMENGTGLKAAIDEGLADIAAGRVKIFEIGRIIEQGRKLSPARFPSG